MKQQRIKILYYDYEKNDFDYVKQTVNNVMNLHGVSTSVGQTALQVTPFSAHSKATAY